MDSYHAWMFFVGLWVFVGSAGQLAYTAVKGHVFNPWSRDRFDNNSCLFWLAMMGSVGGIPFGAMLMLLAIK